MLWLSYVIWIILFATAVAALIVALHIRRHAITMLYEEPIGLLSWAGLVEGSPLARMASEVKRHSGFNGRFTDRVKERYEIERGSWGVAEDAGRDVIIWDRDSVEKY